MNNPRPVMSMRKTVQLLVILTLLAWATQTLFAQWGYGGLILPGAAQGEPAAEGGATIEVRDQIEPTADGTVTLRDVCRWSSADAGVLDPVADLVLARVGEAGATRKISVADIKAALSDAGANLTTVHFTGAAMCAIGGDESREGSLDRAREDARDAARDGSREASREEASGGQADSGTHDVAGAGAGTRDAEAKDPFDAPQPIVADATPATQPFHEEPVAIEEQLLLTRPLSRGQRILASDIEVRRVQVTGPSTRPAVAKDDLVGRLAARDMKRGAVVDAAAVTEPAVVTAGQFMTVAMRIGTTEIETVARAMDTGGTGGVVRAKNEATGDVYRVVVTGPNVGRIAPAAQSDGDSNVAAIGNN